MVDYFLFFFFIVVMSMAFGSTAEVATETVS